MRDQYHSVTDPGSGIRCLFDPRIRDPGWKKCGSGIRDKHSGSETLMIYIAVISDMPGEPDLCVVAGWLC
jgi:hypothetical protein